MDVRLVGSQSLYSDKMRRAVIALALVAVGCGRTPDAPTAPTPTPAASIPNLAGAWTGTVRMTTDIARQGDVRFEMQQAERAVSGTWRITTPGATETRGDMTGTINGTGSAAILTATVTWDAASSQSGVRCRGTSDASGPASSMGFTLSARSVDNLTATNGQRCEGSIRDITWNATALTGN